MQLRGKCQCRNRGADCRMVELKLIWFCLLHWCIMLFEKLLRWCSSLYPNIEIIFCKGPVAVSK